MNISEQTSHFIITEGNLDSYYAKGDLLVYRFDQTADPELKFIHRHTNQVVHKATYSSITGYASADVDEFINNWLADNPVSGGVTLPGVSGAVLYENGAGQLAGNANLVFNGGTKLTIGSGFIDGAAPYLRLGQGVSSAILINGNSPRMSGPLALDSYLHGYATNDTKIRISSATTKIVFLDYLGVSVGDFDNDANFRILKAGKGISFISPDGLTTKVLTIDNAGSPVWT